MTEETADVVANPDDVSAVPNSTDAKGSGNEVSDDANVVDAQDETNSPEFAELKTSHTLNESSGNDLKRLNDVQVSVSAELGRTKVPIQQLLKLTEGSVFELNRSIESPVELIAQGVPLGNGEVVVVDGNFAIRIQEIYAKQ